MLFENRIVLIYIQLFAIIYDIRQYDISEPEYERCDYMGKFEELLGDISFPQFWQVECQRERGELKEPILKQVFKEKLLDFRGRFSGKTVAIAVGSREICNLSVIVKVLIDFLKEEGADSFIIPAMGSHGGASAEGQKTILANYGITEREMGIPIRATMKTVWLGETEEGLPVYFDQYANEADMVIPIGRIKPHTDFRGSIESGILKMLAVGCGKQKGAGIYHSRGFKKMSQNVQQAAEVIMKEKYVPFGVGILEDAFHCTYQIEVLAGECLRQEECILLEKARKLMPRIPFDEIDLLILDEIGKDISGAGMDPNVTGRSAALGIGHPFAEKIVVLDLTEKSLGNASGIGNADITTQRLYEKIDFEATYPNGMTSRDTEGMKIPMVMPNDRCAIKMGMYTCTRRSMETLRIVWIHNTLDITRFYISQSLKEEAKKKENLVVEGKVVFLWENGNIVKGDK